MKTIFAAFLAAVTLGAAAPLWADYVLVLKNGRRITVESYREEAGNIRFRGLGGEIGIPKDQIESVQDVSGGQPAGFSVSPRTQPATPPGPTPTLKPNIGPKLVEKETAAEKPQDSQAREEKEYQEKLKAVTEKLKQLREQYARETRGNTGSEPYLFTTEEAFRGHQQDLLSRLKDAQTNPGPPADAKPVNLVTSSSQGSAPEIRQVAPQRTERIGPPPIESYSAGEKALSNLRREILETQKERDRLIEQMRAKNLDTGSLFLE